MIIIQIERGNIADVNVVIYKPKSLDTTKLNAFMLFFHGG